MSPSLSSEVETIFEQVQAWPAPAQRSLATRILQSLEVSARRPAKPVDNLLGLLATSEPPPSDEECERVIAEERLRKHG
jgi:hypothetical protein